MAKRVDSDAIEVASVFQSQRARRMSDTPTVEAVRHLDDTRAPESLRLRHVPMVFTSPRALFARVEDTGAYGWALVTLILLVTLIGYAQVQTGLIDHDVDKLTEQRLAELEKTQGNLVDRSRLRTSLEDVRKTAEFEKLIMRIVVIGVAPANFLASFMLIAAVLYAAVALTGRKPEWHTLMSICVYAGFVELIAYGVSLAMMLYYRTTSVNTSLAPLGAPGEPTVWAAVDPFRLWFWVLVAIGLIVTRQLSRRVAIASCVFLALVTFGARAALQFAQTG